MRRLRPLLKFDASVSAPAADDAPVRHLRASMLFAALILMSLLPFLSLLHPPNIHRIIVDLKDDLFGEPADGPHHRLEITADRRMILDGSECPDPVALRMGLDEVSLNSNAILEMRIAPEAPYDFVLEILAMTKRASVYHLHLDSGQGPLPPFRIGERQPVRRSFDCEEAGRVWRRRL